MDPVSSLVVLQVDGSPDSDKSMKEEDSWTPKWGMSVYLFSMLFGCFC